MTTLEKAKELATSLGRNWADCGGYEREEYMDEARKVECDCCGAKVCQDEITFIEASKSGAAQCDTAACDNCINADGQS